VAEDALENPGINGPGKSQIVRDVTRGWLESERERAEHDSIKGMSDKEKAETRKKLSAIRTLLLTATL
jgi:hypothetical protein